MSPFTSDYNNKQHSIATTTATVMEAIETTAASVTAELGAVDAGAQNAAQNTASSGVVAVGAEAVAVGAAAGGGGGGDSNALQFERGVGVGVGSGLRAANMMSYQNMIVMLTLLLCGLASVNGLKCLMCGQYNEGVGSITPCLNYSDQYAHNYLKECTKKSEKFCVKYVSGLSTVRDCATECVEKEVWETKTFCCNTDGCNGSSNLGYSKLLLLMPLLYYCYKELMNVFNLRH